MTKEEARQVFLSRGYVEVEGGTIYDANKWRESYRVISEWLEQESCDDCVSRQVVIDAFEKFIHEFGIKDEPYNYGEMVLSAKNVPPVTPQTKVGHWVLTQRDKCIDISCSECGNIRFKDYTCKYAIDELNLKKINDLIAKIRMNYCECCGAKMQTGSEG